MAANQHTTSSRQRFFFFFSGVPLMECSVSMIRRQRTQSLDFLQAEWILMLADCT